MPTRSHANSVVLIGMLCLGGCARVGPDFQPQHEAWAQQQWTTPALDQAGMQRPQPDASQWWQVFADPTLEQLIAEADAHNAGVQIAGLRVMEARAQLGIAQSGRYPQAQVASGDLLYRDRREAGAQNPQSKSFWQYSAGLDVGWELDFWGRFSRAIESADAAWFAASANYEDVLVLLHAQIAETYYALRTAEARLRIARDNAQLQKRSYEITEKLFKSGQTDELDFQQAKTQYLGTASTIPDLEIQIMRARNALSALIGQPPGSLPELAHSEGVVPLVSRAILQDVPANLLLRRPDVRAAEQQVAAQSALIGVAKADLYPSVTLLGSLVWSSGSLEGIPNGLTLIGGPSVRWNIFDHGAIKNNVRVQDARLQQLIVAYLVNRSNAVSDLIALYKALGGGWHSEEPLVDPTSRQQMQKRTDWGDLLDHPGRPAADISTPAQR